MARSGVGAMSGGGLHRAGGGADLGQGIKGGGAVLSDRIEDNLRVVHLH